MRFTSFINILTLAITNAVLVDDDGYTDLLPSAETLRLVQVLYRHGDRSQTRNYTNDIYKETDWPQGYGQLTTQGMKQEFMLGEYFRQAYVETGFLNPEYTRSEVYVRSTSYERALMSAYCVLSALFQPDQTDRQTDRLDNLEIAWQPVPVHTVPLEEDYLLMTQVSCPAYSTVKSQETKSIIEQTMNDFSEFYDIVSEKSGEPNTFDGVGLVLDPIFCQDANNFTLPGWVTEDIFDQILQLRDIYAAVNFRRDLAYLKGGLLVGEMLDHMINKSKKDESIPQKLFMYSAHDSNVITFLTTLGIFNDRQPPYTACVIVELHELQPGEFVIQFSYKNETDEAPYILKLPDCGEVCPLDEFAQIVKHLVPKDPKAACGPNSATIMQTSSQKLATITVIVLLCLILIMVVIVAILCCIKRDKLVNAHDYMPVPVEMPEGL